MTTQAEQLRQLSGTEWPAAVGELWNGAASRFATSWEDLSHHDQLTVYRLLTEPVAPAPAAEPAVPDTTPTIIMLTSTKIDGRPDSHTDYLGLPHDEAVRFVQTHDGAIDASCPWYRNAAHIVDADSVPEAYDVDWYTSMSEAEEGLMLVERN